VTGRWGGPSVGCTSAVIFDALALRVGEAARAIDPNLKGRLLNRPRAKELSKLRAPAMTLREFREKFGGPGVSDDEAILRYFAGEEYVAAMKAAGPPREYASRKSPLLMLIEQAIKHKNSRQIYVRHGNLTVRLEKRKEVQTV